MIIVSVVDKKMKSYEARAQRAASFIEKELKTTGKITEIFIVGNDELPKNVLAFPANNSFPRPDLTLPALGEIYLNPSYIIEHKEDFEFMLIHGFLHLLGYDHIEKSDRMKMEKMERKLLQQIAKSA